MPHNVDRAFLARDIVSGAWEFGHGVTLAQLITVARGWRDGPYGHLYTSITIQHRTADLHFGISIQYKTDEGGLVERKRMIDRTVRELTDTFGENFLGGHISQYTFVVK